MCHDGDVAGGMGGGWGKRGSGVPLAQRVRAGHPQVAEVAAPGAAPDEACPARHCWVSDAADGSGVKRPGLLVEWRALDGLWEGRVLYLALLRPGLEPRWALVEEWLPADLLTPC
jgi:hypothetical protein